MFLTIMLNRAWTFWVYLVRARAKEPTAGFIGPMGGAGRTYLKSQLQRPWSTESGRPKLDGRCDDETTETLKRARVRVWQEVRSATTGSTRIKVR